MAKKKADFSLMGKRVVVTEEFERQYSGPQLENVNWIVCKITPRTGWVVGYRHMQEGSLEYDYSEDGVGAYFNQKNAIPCILVTFNPRHNYIRVPLSGVKEV